MNDRALRWLGVAFAFVVVLGGLAIVTHAQESTITQVEENNATIEYNYTDSSVEYIIDERYYTSYYPYNLSTQSRTFTSSWSVDDFATLRAYSLSWNETGEILYVTVPFANGELINEVSAYEADEPYGEPDNFLGVETTTNDYLSSYGVSPDQYGHTYYTRHNDDGTGFFYQDDNLLLETFEGNAIDFEWSPNGDYLYLLTWDDASLIRYTANTPYDATSIDTFGGIAQDIDINTLGEPRGLEYANEHLYYIADSETHQINADWDEPNSISVNQTYERPSYYNSLLDMDFGGNGQSAMYYGIAGADVDISRYTLSNSNTVDVEIRDNTGTVASTTTDSLNNTGNIDYVSSMYRELTLFYESNGANGFEGQSNTIGVYGDGNMSIRSELDNSLIAEPVNVTAYGEESGIYSLDTSDGTIDITGLPDQSYTFSTDASGYEMRNKYVDELGNVDSLYLLSNETDRVTTQFLLEDTTNTFTQDARLIIERSIEGDGNDWEAIYSDSFGVEGVTVTLEEGVRYRISIENDETRRTIGPYRATVSEQVTINPTSGDIGVDSEGSWSMGANYDSDQINVRYTDPQDTTDSVSITIYERGNESNTIIDDDTYVTPTDLRAEYDVPDEYNESNWIVEMNVERNGESTTVSMQVGPTLDTVPTDLDPMWRNVISVIVILTFGLSFSVLNRAVGAIVLALVGGTLWWVGWLAGATAGVLITAYLFIAIGYGIYTKSVR